jgi:2,4-dienoyl-CoA reductase-like NADH-dependent reductase (Old Yellow Enzyme family)
LNEPLVLANGSTVRNRIAKAAMEEQLAGPDQLPSDALIELYRQWGRSGAGLLITGHVMIDRRAVAQPGDVVLDAGQSVDRFARWASAAKAEGARVWMQINHPGRVVLADMKGLSWAPSAVPLEIGRLSRMYAQPVEMTPAQIWETIERFAQTAQQAEAAGFDGVEVHAAHGYLLSQFLSPLVNRRTDAWGGSLANRARMMIEVVRAIRSATSPTFAVGVKLNSADFQRGGFEQDDAEHVLELLAPERVDLVELSGGSIESLATSGTPADGYTLAREAYFLELAERLVTTSRIPLMLTGGIRRRAVAQQVIDAGIAVAGSATAFAMDPKVAGRWLAGEDAERLPPRTRLGGKLLRSAIVQAAVTRRLHVIANRRDVTSGSHGPPVAALVLDQLRRRRQLARYLRWVEAT